MTKQEKVLADRRILVVDGNRAHARLHTDICELMGGAKEISNRTKIDEATIRLMQEKSIDTVIIGCPVSEDDYLEHGGRELDTMLSQSDGMLRRVVVVSMTADLPTYWNSVGFSERRNDKAVVIYFRDNQQLIDAIIARKTS